MIMKARAISILVVVILAAVACLPLGGFDLSNSTAEAGWGRNDYLGRTYSEAATVTITVDGLTMRLFERHIRQNTPWGFDENGVPLGIPTRELFERVYESLGWKVKERYGRDEADAMTDIALDSLVENGRVSYDFDTDQWRQGHGIDYQTKFWRVW